MKIKDKILSETSEEVKQRIRDTANKLVMKEETKCYCGHTTTCDCGELSKIEMLAIEERNNKNLKSVISSFIVGYEKAQETLYSEEEVKNIVEQTIEKFYKHFYTLTKAEMKEQWFEQFKKK